MTGAHAGSVDELLASIDEHAARMPRTMLRYAIERLPDGVRRQYRAVRKSDAV